MATREELIKSLKACANGNCTECAYNQGEIGDDICEKANGVVGCGCYDRMMADAAKMLEGKETENCLPQTSGMACEEKRICKQDGHFYAEIIPLADRINYICSFITDSSMKYKKPVRLSLVDELYELVKYYDRFAISEEDNSNWGSNNTYTF